MSVAWVATYPGRAGEELGDHSSSCATLCYIFRDLFSFLPNRSMMFRCCVRPEPRIECPVDNVSPILSSGAFPILASVCAVGGTTTSL
mmetsp:Transcript_20821/g.57893  ORF Transcript_20821/g.57893 Transcript_20821/m.57893 type:complete len:88 (-) Transcript_20821:429-692(-)